MKNFYTNEAKQLKECLGNEPVSHILMEVEEYNALNFLLQNLKRINKERSNAERGLKPKKERSGFILLSYDTNNFNMKFGEKLLSNETRRLLLETPYTVKLGYKQALQLVLDDLNPIATNFGAMYCIDKSTIIAPTVLESLFKPDSDKVLIVSGLEAQRNGAWAVRIYANFTPDIPVDCIKQNENER